LTASQAGNTNYRAAANVSVSFTVAVATPVTPVTPVTSAATGKVLYNTAFNGQSCASCHSIMPVLNVSKVLKGANSASTIQNAINGDKGGMGVLRGAISTQQLNDIAAYLATPNL
jgi:mono/diheme cytochrome c family protein